MKNTADASWHIELNTNCPHCDEWIDLMDITDDWEGMPQAGESVNKLDKEYTCPKCKKDFIVNRVEY